MPLVKQKHQDIVEDKVAELISDLGRPMKVHLRTDPVDCTWCEFSHEFGRSLNKPATGKDWSTHPNYKGSTRLCPNCLGNGTVETDEVITVTNVITSEIKGLTLINGRPALVPSGRIKITGNLIDIDANRVVVFTDDSDYAYITDADQSGLDVGTDSFMVEFYAKAGTSDGAIIKKVSTAGWTATLTGTTISMVITDGTDSSTTSTALPTQNPEDWVHIAILVNKTTDLVTIYVDGTAISTYTSRDSLTDVDSLDNAGQFQISGNTTVGGSVDEVRLWNYGSSIPSDIETIILNHYKYAHTLYKTTDTTQLKGWWIMEEID